MKYHIIYGGCGHEGVLELYGKTTQREYIIKSNEEDGLCDECRKIKFNKIQEEIYQKALKTAKELKLPDLTGTEKQIKWAMKIRQDFLDKIESLPSIYSEKYMIDSNVKYNFAIFVANSIISAVEWINYSNERTYTGLLNKYFKLYINNETPEGKKEKIILHPDNTKFMGEVTINIDELQNIIDIRYAKNEDFKEIVKNLEYKWDSDRKLWTRKILNRYGNINDRAIEIASKLLKSGFVININTPDLKNKIENGEYMEEHKKWVTLNMNEKSEYYLYLCLEWHGRNNDLYSESRKIKNSVYYNSYVQVPVKSYKQLIEFAKKYDFKFTKAAQNAIDMYKNDIKREE